MHAMALHVCSAMCIHWSLWLSSTWNNLFHRDLLFFIQVSKWILRYFRSKFRHSITKVRPLWPLLPTGGTVQDLWNNQDKLAASVCFQMAAWVQICFANFIYWKIAKVQITQLPLRLEKNCKDMDFSEFFGFIFD